MADESRAERLRREPPSFRKMSVVRKAELTPRMLRVTFTGEELDGLEITEPAASVRLLIPSPGSDELVIPTWNGNEFLLDDGERPVIRTFTPRHWSPDDLELVLDIVLHDGGSTASWAGDAEHGAEAAVSGPGRGYVLDPEATEYVLAGDETAIPAICQLIEHIPKDTKIEAIIEVVAAEAIHDLPRHAALETTWLTTPSGTIPGDLMVATVSDLSYPPGSRLWAAGEAATVHKIRKTLVGEKIDRQHATIRGYWKRDR